MSVRWTGPVSFPIAPSSEASEAFPLVERELVFAGQSRQVTDGRRSLSGGDRHFSAKARALEMLRDYFVQRRRRIYLAAEMPTYYPAQPGFAPDLIAVVEADGVERDKWVVSAEGRGLDWVLEIHVGGSRKKDAERNVTRYAQLGITEYFIYDRASNWLSAYRLPSPNARAYIPIRLNHGVYESQVLGLDVQIYKDRLEFYEGTALLLEREEIVARLQATCDRAHRCVEEEARLRKEEARLHEDASQRAEEATRRAEEETRRREEAEQGVARLRAELERLRR